MLKSLKLLSPRNVWIEWRRTSAGNVVIVGDSSITSYQQRHGKALWYGAEVVSAQSEVGKLDEGSKGQGIDIPLAQQIPLQFQDNQAAKTFGRIET